jgi:hypothetical protein
MKPFPWGKVTQIHTIGTHEITEYVVGGAYENRGLTEFHLKTGKNFGILFDTLDEALLTAICMKHGGEYEDIPYVKRILNWED